LTLKRPVGSIVSYTLTSRITSVERAAQAGKAGGAGHDKPTVGGRTSGGELVHSQQQVEEHHIRLRRKRQASAPDA
jgi:hypothetical protein